MSTDVANTQVVYVTVNPAPVLAATKTIPTGRTIKIPVPSAAVNLVGGLAQFFADDAGMDFAATVASDPAGVIATDATLISGDNLQVTPLGPGTVMIKITATETTGGLGQFIETTISATFVD